MAQLSEMQVKLGPQSQNTFHTVRKPAPIRFLCMLSLYSSCSVMLYLCRSRPGRKVHLGCQTSGHESKNCSEPAAALLCPVRVASPPRAAVSLQTRAVILASRRAAKWKLLVFWRRLVTEGIARTQTASVQPAWNSAPKEERVTLFFFFFFKLWKHWSLKYLSKESSVSSWKPFVKNS